MQTSQERSDGFEEQGLPTVTQTIDIDATVEQVWDAVATQRGREAWIEPDPDRVMVVADQQPPTRITWWWWSADEAAGHVDVRLVRIPGATRVIVTETAPGRFPLARMSAHFERALVSA